MEPRAGHYRRSVRLQEYDYSQRGAYFVTIVTQRRDCIFGAIVDGVMRLSDRGKIAQACWREIPRHFPQIELGAFVVMPNHVHGILVLHGRAEVDASARRGTIYRAPTEQFQRPVGGSIPTIMHTYKAAVTRQTVRRLGEGQRVWQPNYYEHVIRNDDEWNRIHSFIEGNATQWNMDDENPENMRW